MPGPEIDEDRVQNIARNFVCQHHSVHSVAAPILEGQVWSVEVLTLSPARRRFRVQISALTGRILCFAAEGVRAYSPRGS